MRVTRKSLMIISTIVLTSLFAYISFNYAKVHELYNFYDILKVVLMTNFIILLDKYKLKKISTGCFLVLLGWLSNYVISLNVLQDNSLISVFYDICSLGGVFFLIFGIFQATRDNEILVKRLQTFAFYDRLTKLPNRNLVMNSCPVNEEGKRCKRKRTCVCLQRDNLFNSKLNSTLFYIDIDNFKQVNNNLGHLFGDNLLEQIAKRLKDITSKDDVVVRLTGDEFLIICYNMDSSRGLEEKAGSILKEMSTPFSINGRDVNISCSMGIAFFPEHGKNIEKVIAKADIAMDTAKKDGKNQFCIYNERLEKESNTRYDLTNELKTAINNKDFVVYYQPKANLNTGEITGLEALVRWNHPVKGLVYPNSFIPLAEETGLIRELDLLVVNIVCGQIEKWYHEGKKPYNISVNISPILFNDRLFISKLDAILSAYSISPSDISIEITENIAFSDVEQTKRKILELRKRKIKVYLDDFGKGYSSLTYIKQYPIDYLKIDKSFIDDIIKNRIDQSLVNTVIAVSNYLGIKVVSEGVETKDQLDFLRQLGCHEYQGYYLSKPQPIEMLNIQFKK